MRRLPLWPAVFAMSLFCAHAAAAQSPPAVLTLAQAQEDFDVMRRSLQEAHGGLYRHTPRAELEARFDALRARLHGDVSQREMTALISEMVAAVRCGHTRLEYDSTTVAALATARVFPLRVLVEGRGLRVMYNDAPGDTTIRAGMEVLDVNGHPAADLIAALQPLVPGDGFIETGRRYRLSRGFATLYWLFVAPDSAFAVTARDDGGRMVRATLSGVLASERTRVRNPVNAQMAANAAALDGGGELVSLRFVDAEVAHLRIRGFDGDSFPAQLRDAFGHVRERGARALILDLRGDPGGVDEYGALLVSHFMDRPFRYFDHIRVPTLRPSFATWKPATFDALAAGTEPDPAGGYRITAALHTGVGVQAPDSAPFLGPVVVLTDGGTFSTAADVAAVLRHHRRAPFVGEETAGGYHGNTSNLNALIVLPHSRLRLKIPMYGYWTAVSGGEPGRGVIPDHVVARGTADLLRGVDPQWERALMLARQAMAR